MWKPITITTFRYYGENWLWIYLFILHIAKLENFCFTNTRLSHKTVKIERVLSSGKRKACETEAGTSNSNMARVATSVMGPALGSIEYNTTTTNITMASVVFSSDSEISDKNTPMETRADFVCCCTIFGNWRRNVAAKISSCSPGNDGNEVCVTSIMTAATSAMRRGSGRRVGEAPVL